MENSKETKIADQGKKMIGEIKETLDHIETRLQIDEKCADLINDVNSIRTRLNLVESTYLA